MANRIDRQLLKKNGGNQSEMARYIGVSPQAVQKWIAGDTEPRGKNLEKAAEFLGVSPAFLRFGPNQDLPSVSQPKSLATGQSNVEDAPAIAACLKRIPIVGRVQAGPDGTLHIDDFAHGDGYMLWWSTCSSAYALRIRGESMSPRYLPGEFVGVDPCADVNPSDEVIVLLKTGERMIKRLLWRREDQACFESVNKDFQNIIFDLEEVDALHLVIGHIPKTAFRSE
ncbi:MAG: helix-turn-helix domain-containing protein [Telluria sp.]